MAHNHTTGSISRQERRRQAKVQARLRKRRKRQAWKAVQGGRTSQRIRPTPRAGSYLVRRFWEYFGLTEALEGLGIRKFKGLAASTLLLIALLFGVLGAQSVSDLTDKARADQILIECCAADLVERKQLYRFLGKMTQEQYQDWLQQILRRMQTDPRTASRPSGVVAGDETTILKSGKKMPGISWVFKSSEQRFGLGYEIVSTCYADLHKFYSLFCAFRLPTEAQLRVQAETRKKKKLGVDQRKPANVVRWLEQQVTDGEPPEMVVLSGSHLGQTLTHACERLALPWLGLSDRRRVFWMGEGKARHKVKASQVLDADYERCWQHLTDAGYRIATVGLAQANKIGQVVLLVAECLADGGRLLIVARPDEDAHLLERVHRLLAQRGEADNTKLHLMLELLRQGREIGIRAETATFDRWFYAVWFIQDVLALGFKRVIIKARANLRYLYRGEELTIDQLQRQISDYRQAPGSNRRLKFAALRVIQPGLGRIKLVFVREYSPQGTLTQEYALMCTDPRYANHKIYRAYKLRWRIEEIYRETRQNHALEAFHTRNFNAIYAHVFLSFLSHTCLVVTRLLSPKLQDMTLGQIMGKVFRACVELLNTVKGVIVRFTDEFLECYGLPAFCT
jgi:hypothetical protein